MAGGWDSKPVHNVTGQLRQFGGLQRMDRFHHTAMTMKLIECDDLTPTAEDDGT